LLLLIRWLSVLILVIGFIFVVCIYGFDATQDATKITREGALSLGLILDEFEGPVVRTYDYFGSKDYSWIKSNDDLGSSDGLVYDPYENRICWTKTVAKSVLHSDCIVAKDKY
jgi:hypothetical protein